MVTIINNRYRLDTLIGEGGMGLVYQAFDSLTRQSVALKYMTTPQQTLDGKHDTQELTKLNRVLANEFRTLASLRHPNIISVLDYGFDTQKRPFLTMELLSSSVEITDTVVDKPRPDQIRYLLDILQALRYLHQRNIIHRDLKPSNILIENDTVRVLDFGLALNVDADNPQKTTAGTLAYLAPEVLYAQPASVASDLYAFGIVAHEVLVGKHPYPFESQTELINQVLLHNPDISSDILSDELESFLMRLLSKSPEDRYASALDTMHALCDVTGYPFPEETEAIRESILVSANFVGREQEISQLEASLQNAIAGEGQFILIGGESGVGKTRLMDEFRISALVQGANVMRGQAVAEGGLLYQVFRGIIRNLLLIVPITDDEASILVSIVPDIAILLEREIPSYDRDESAIQQRLPLILSNLLTQASEQTPLVILLEDLQWTSEAIDILHKILPLLTKQRVMVVGNYRSDEAPHLPERLPEMTVMPLPRLDESSIRKLSISMLGQSANSNAVIELVQRESEGNAFFIIEVIRTLANEVGQLSDIGIATLPAQIFVGGIQKIVERRLNKLPAWALYPLQVASVLGRRIDAAVLRYILPELDFQKWVTICNEASVIEIVDSTWQFAHDKIREYVQANIESSRRKHLHEQVATAIEALHPNELDDYAVVLALHFQLAENKTKEAYYSSIGAQTLKPFDPPQALRLVNRAIALDVHQQFDNMIEKQADVQLLKANILADISDFDNVETTLNSALERYQSIDHELGIARVQSSMGELLMHQSKLNDALSILQTALPVLRDHNDNHQVAMALMNLAATSARRNDMSMMEMYCQQCYETAQTLNDEILLGKSLNNLANVHAYNKEFDKSLELHNRALEIRRRINDKRGLVSSLVNIGSIEGDQGEHEQERKYLLDALEYAHIVNARMPITNIYNALGKVEFHLGNDDVAQEYIDQSLALAYELELHHYIRLNYSILGNASLKQGDNEQAADHFFKALDSVAPLEVQPLKLKAILDILTLRLDTITQETLFRWAVIALAHAEHLFGRDDLVSEYEKLKSELAPDIAETIIKGAEEVTLNELVTEILATRKPTS